VTRRDWRPIIDAANAAVRTYPYLITLRQLHYLLVSDPDSEYRNTDNDYDKLSEKTAKARREGWFPSLRDDTRAIHQAPWWASPADALADLVDQYRYDRTAGQDNLLVLGGEKATLLAQLDDWFGELGLPIVLLRGHTSQTYVDKVAARVLDDGRPAVLLYAGDLDPSGDDILRDFLKRCPVFAKVERVAVTETQINDLGLTRNPGKPSDSRAKTFVAKYGTLFQVEVEAIPPQDLRDAYQDALDRWWDESAYEEALAQEEADREQLRALIPMLGGMPPSGRTP
jgi:hypothetical protein